MKDLGKGIAAVAIMGGAATAVVVGHETINGLYCAVIIVAACLACVALFKNLDL